MLSVILLMPIWEALLPQPPCSILRSTEPGQCQPLRSPSQSLPCGINQRQEPSTTESCGWGGGITKTKIKEHLLVHVCQLSQLKEQEENKA